MAGTDCSSELESSSAPFTIPVFECDVGNVFEGNAAFEFAPSVPSCTVMNCVTPGRSGIDGIVDRVLSLNMLKPRGVELVGCMCDACSSVAMDENEKSRWLNKPAGATMLGSVS